MIKLKVDSKRNLSFIERDRILQGEHKFDTLQIALPEKIDSNDEYVSGMLIKIFFVHDKDRVTRQVIPDQNLNVETVIDYTLTEKARRWLVYVCFYKVGDEDIEVGKTNPVAVSVNHIPYNEALDVKSKDPDILLFKGEKGDKGDPGKDGVDGKDGIDGKDGKDGEQGPQGEKGDKGDPGKDGVDGKDGIDGKDGKDGEQGPQGEKGDKGDPGKDGVDGSEYDDTELRSLILQKAPIISVQTEPSYDTDFIGIEDKADGYELSATIPENPLGYSYLFVSKNKNLLPNINTASQIGEVGGITVEVVNGTVCLNGTCTTTVKTWLGVNSGSVITMNDSLNANEVITAGMLHKGSINEKSIKTIIRLVDGVNTQIQESITGNGVYKKTLEAQAACTQLRIYLEIPVGAQLDNYTITPFCFKGINVNQIDNPSFPYTIDITDYNYLSTYPNNHVISYAADTKKYIDKHSSDIDMSVVDEHINTKVNPIKTDVATLNKKVTYITPEQYGAIGDGVTDDTVALQTCLSKASSANVVMALKYYKITAPVRMAANHVNVKINRIDYSGEDFAIKLATRFSNVKIKLINATNGGGVLIKDDNNTTTVDSNHFEFNYINSLSDCIKFEATKYWNIVHNIFVVPWLKSTNGNLINAGNNCTENTFIGGKTNCLNNWCINNYWATNVYTRFSFEKNSSMICYGRAQIIDCRTAEALNSYPSDTPPLPEGVFMKLNKTTEKMGHCLSDINTQCTYTGVNLDDVNSFEDALAGINQKIAEQDPDDEQRFFIGCREIVEYSPGIIENVSRYNGISNVTSTDGTLDGKMVIYWNKKAYVPNHEVIENIITTPFVPLQTIINNPTYFKIGVANCVINLNDSYCPVGIDSFVVEQTDDYKATIYNKDGLLIFDGENKAAGIYQVKCYVTPLSSDIFANINMPDSRKEQYAHRIRHIYTGSNEKWEITTPDYTLTSQDKTDIANIVLQLLPTTQGVLYGD